MMGKHSEVKDPVAQAEARLGQARAELAECLKEIERRSGDIARLREQLGADPESKLSGQWAGMIVRDEARVAWLERRRKPLEQALREAESALRKVQSDEAEATKRALEDECDAFNQEAREHIRLAEEALDIKRAKLAEARDLAQQFSLTAVRQCRLLLPRSILLCPAGEELRGALDVRRADGVTEGRDAGEAGPLAWFPSSAS